MTSALIIFYVFIALLLIALVLLQDPKGGGGALFGGGSKSLFGATGATSFIVKATRAVAVLFAVCVIGINFMLMRSNNSSAVDTDTEITAPVLGGAAVEDATKVKVEKAVKSIKVEQTEEAPKGEEQ